ncbi:acetolactate synthase large subunit [Acuticoccus sp. I52.16.1]|uniref:acetolactate synthase large subunit n=1 Tax=Acuticoccus sp. I52.16.1 TaxID=2928472 RepID=UPI001FD624FB|nr:acetolactate synthase large subunit [Acuticoccus sp. I52.16.1]UOM35098.1 acetolactate synthase large subunit [Acuticoccus sp. I52.16.1]
MNGAESLVRTLSAGGVDVCFANPGTSEMQFVDALDRTRLMRCVLGLFEGVVTGAADGYGRMAGKPAATLLHLAPGMANASANLHNAKKARTPILNLVGDHALRHQAYDAPLSADVEAAALPFSDFVRMTRSAADIGADGAEALAAAMSAPGKIATLICPSDTGWDEGGVVAEPRKPQGPAPIDAVALDAAVEALGRGHETMILVGGSVLEDVALTALVAGIAERTGCRVAVPAANRRLERGRGRANFAKVPFAVDLAVEMLADVRTLVMIEARQPVAFFAYPGKPSVLLPDACTRLTLADLHEDGPDAVRALADRVGARPARIADAPRATAPQAVPISYQALEMAIAAALPEDAIVVDEGLTAGRGIYDATFGAPPMSWIAITGGSIGIGPPMAAGAAIACPDRPVVSLQADGSAMYTIQGLWTQARENANVTTVIFANGTYEILKHELTRVGANPGRSALDMLEINRPSLDFVSLAKGMGVPGVRVEDAATLCQAIRDSVKEPGPKLIEAILA